MSDLNSDSLANNTFVLSDSPSEGAPVVAPIVVAANLKQLGPYKILRELGRGAMGTVYEAKHAQLERQVALKVLPSELATSPKRLQRFRREMAAVGRLDHPNIVLATDAGDKPPSDSNTLPSKNWFTEILSQPTSCYPEGERQKFWILASPCFATPNSLIHQ